ncbi:hypothetical protein MTO96_027049 [Rhipicephalus appendiculatus]
MDKLRRHRGALRGSTTRLLSEASEILLQDTLPSSADLQERIDGLRDKDTALAELDKQIADALDGEEFDAEIVVALEYHERIVKAISRLRSAINACPLGHHRPKPRRPQQATSTSLASRFAETSSAPLQRRDPDLTGIEKFKYLKTYLAGAAKRAIEGVRLTEVNYNIAVKVLTERIGRKDLLVDDHIDSLLAIEPIETSSHVSRLRDLYEQIQFRTGCLESLGMPSSEYAVVLHRVLMRSLPDDLAIQYGKRMKTETDVADSVAQSRDEQVKAILKFLQVEVESTEETRASHEKTTSGRASTNRKAGDTVIPPHLPSALALTARSPSPGAR